MVSVFGTRRWSRYRLKPLDQWKEKYDIHSPGLTEDNVWRELAPRVAWLPKEDGDICHYGTTEIFNNVLDHSGADHAVVTFARTATSVSITIEDDGVGIFQKIASALGLADPRLSLLELSKGKFTTDPTKHTGEGIFFNSRMFDRFLIRSADLLFFHRTDSDDWLVDDKERSIQGTRITMQLLVPTSRVMQDVFSNHSSGPDDYRFAKTHVPIRLAQFGDEALVSRSSAKRVLSRVEKFDEVLLDFTGVRAVGQAFADEIFRVFATAHPKTQLIGINMNEQITLMVQRAKANRGGQD